MSTKFQINNPSLESQWRAIILFGKNSATYKFAFANAMIELLPSGKSSLSFEELAAPFSKNIVEHLRKSDKQGNSSSSKFLNTCRDFIADRIRAFRLLDYYGINIKWVKPILISISVIGFGLTSYLILKTIHFGLLLTYSFIAIVCGLVFKVEKK